MSNFDQINKLIRDTDKQRLLCILLGAAGSALSGGVTGGVAASGAGLLFTGLATTAADVGAGFVSKIIDHQSYSLKDTINDFANSLIGQVQGGLLGKEGTLLKRLLEGRCQVLHFIMNPTPNVSNIFIHSNANNIYNNSTELTFIPTPNFIQKLGPLFIR